MLYLILIAIWPLVNYLSLNYSDLSSYHEILTLSSVVISGVLLAYFIAKYLLKLSIDRLILPLLLGTALFFSYLDIIEKIIAPYNIAPFIKPSYIYLIIFIVIIYSAWKISVKSDFQKISKLLVITVFTLSLANFAFKIFPQTSKLKTETKTENPSFKFIHKPNIYYILVDAYGRQDTLKELMKYNNDPFLKKLSSKGFIISKSATSNYHFTIPSLSATMNMGYHAKDEATEIPRENMLLSLKGINKVRNILRQNGYYIINAPAYWHKAACYGNEDLCLTKQSYEIYQTFLFPTPLRKIKFPSYIDLDSIKAISKISTTNPKFTFIHLAQIHDVIFDESGNTLPPSHCAKTLTDENIRKRYSASVKIMNHKLLTFADHLIKSDPKSIIIIQADHGPSIPGNLHRIINKRDFFRAFGIFTAIRLPNYNNDDYQEIKNYFSSQFSLVNTFKYVFAYLSGKTPELLPENSYFLYKCNSCANTYKQANISHFKN